MTYCSARKRYKNIIMNRVRRAIRCCTSASICVYTCADKLMCVSLCISALKCPSVCVFVLYACSVRPGHGVLQGHVLCSSEGQSVRAVVVDQLGDAGEDTAALIQCEAQTFSALCLRHNDVHTTLTCPGGTGENRLKNTHKIQKYCRQQGEDTNHELQNKWKPSHVVI